MEYQLDLSATVKALFVPFNAEAISFLMIVLLSMLACYFIKFRNYTLNRRILTTIVIFGLVVIVCLFGAIRGANVGWSLNDDDTLTINAPPANATINLSDCRIDLVDASSNWRISKRVNGSSTAGLSYGRFKLNNGENAIYFRHLNNDKMLLLSCDNNLYLIEHPNIEALYAELISRGVMHGIL